MHRNFDRPLRFALLAGLIGISSTAWAQVPIVRAVPTPYAPDVADPGDGIEAAPYYDPAPRSGRPYARPYAYDDRYDFDEERYEVERFDDDRELGYDPEFDSGYSYGVSGQQYYGAEDYDDVRGYRGYGEVTDLYQSELESELGYGVDNYYTDDWYDYYGDYNRWY